MKTAVILKIFNTDPATLNNSKRLINDLQGSEYDIFIIYDNVSNLFDVPSCNISYQNYIKSGYKLATDGTLSIIPTQIMPQTHESRVMWFNPEYQIMLWWREHKDEYDYVWSVESDIFCNGDWKNIFNSCKNDNSDLLASTVSSFGSNMFNGFWDLYSEKIKNVKKLKAFGAIHRYTKRMLNTTEEYLQKGWHSYYELTMPTIANLEHYKIKTINEVYMEENQGKMCYNPLTLTAAEFTQWANMLGNDRNPNFLFHPVKKLVLNN